MAAQEPRRGARLDPQEEQEEHLDAAFAHWWSTIEGALHEARSLARPVLKVTRDRRVQSAQISLSPSAPATVEVSRGFLAELHTEVSANAAVLDEACLNEVKLAVSPEEARQRLLACVRDLAVSFALLHELFHVLCGHFDAKAQALPRQALSYNEAELSIEGQDSQVPKGPATDAPSDTQVLRAYFLELEADNSALQWMIRSPPRSRLDELLRAFEGAPSGPPVSAVYLLEGIPRIVTFRVLVAAVWLVVRLFERRRGPALRQRAKAHPLPGARLLAAISLLMQEFAEMDPNVDQNGRQSQILGESDAEDLRTFFLQVLGPVFRAPWPVRDPAAAVDGFETFPIWVASELGNLMFDKPPETAPGRELASMDGLRHEMSARLHPHRYMAEMKGPFLDPDEQ